MKYKVSLNGSEEVREAPLGQFLSEVPTLFVAGLVPPRDVIADVCLAGKKSGLGQLSWEPYTPDENEYLLASKYLEATFGFRVIEAPKDIDNFFKWSVWQYSVSHGVPYEQHLALAEQELYWDQLLSESEIGDDELLEIHLKKVAASNAVDDLLRPYLTGGSVSQHGKDEAGPQ